MELKNKIIKNVPYIIFIIIACISFYLLIQQFGQTFSEYDTYMYLTNAQVILSSGHIRTTGLAYGTFANQTSNRFAPLMPYAMAGLTSITSKLFGASLLQTANIYPPLLFILMSAMVFILFERAYKEKLGDTAKWLGLIGAILFLSIPVLFQQFTAGMFQEEAFGFFSVIALIVTFYIANKDKSYLMALLAGIVYIGVLLGSKYFTVISIIVPFFIFVEALVLFLKNEDLKKFVYLNAIIVGFATLGNIFLAMYHGGFAVSGFTLHGIFIPINLVLLIVALLFAFLLSIDWNKLAKRRFISRLDEKTNNLIITLGIMILISIPVLPKIVSYGSYLLSFSVYQGLPLFKTVQEFTPSPVMDMSSYFGVLFGSPYIYFGILGIFTIMLAYKLYKHDNDMLGLLLIPAVYPLFYTAMSLAKYIADGSIVLVLAIVYIMAEILLKIKGYDDRRV